MKEPITRRVRRLKCPACGNTNKKFMDILYGKRVVGYATSCCECGHIEMAANDIEGFGYILHGECTLSDYICPMKNPWCPNKDCPKFDPNNPNHIRKPKKHHGSVYRDSLHEIKPPKKYV